MKEYKRLTVTKKINEYCSTVECMEHCEDCYVGKLYERLAELEDKIENGTLIELDIWDKDILEDYARRMFDSWNEVTGAIHEGSSWYGEVLSVIDDIVGMVYGITARKYEQKLKELKEV